MTSSSLQRALFAAIKKQLPNGHSLADGLKPILKRTKNAVYKRINGTTPLTLEDICLLSEHFHLPFAEILQPPQPTRFMADFSGFGAQTSATQYLDLLEKELSVLKDEKSTKVWYVTSGLPDFYFFYFPALTLFKIFIWERMVWGSEQWQRRDFKLNIPEREFILEKTKKLVDYYGFIHTTELWNEELLDSLFRQLLYVAESRLYTKGEDILQVCEATKDLIHHLEEMAYAERHFRPNENLKTNQKPFYLYYNETMQNNIFLLMENEKRREVYTVLNTPNYIKTGDDKMANYMREQIQQLMQRSVPLGKPGEKYRHIYFDKLKNRFQYYAGRISKLIKKTI